MNNNLSEAQYNECIRLIAEKYTGEQYHIMINHLELYVNEPESLKEPFMHLPDELQTIVIKAKMAFFDNTRQIAEPILTNVINECNRYVYDKSHKETFMEGAQYMYNTREIFELDLKQIISRLQDNCMQLEAIIAKNETK